MLAKIIFDGIKGSIPKSLTKSNIERDYFLFIDVLREYDDMKEEINMLETS